MKREEAVHFLGQLRLGRAAALRDAEGFHAIFHALERLGYFLTGKAVGLGRYREDIGTVAGSSPLAEEIPARHPELHPPFARLFEQVRRGRNQAVHEGAYARHLTQHATELALVVEDALMAKCMVAQDFMVRAPVMTELWEPISFIRQKMLINSFSFLPVRVEREWRLISDRALARYVRAVEADEQRNERLAQPLQAAVENGLAVDDADTCGVNEPVRDVAARITDRPVLVVRDSDGRELLGILTAFDVM